MDVPKDRSSFTRMFHVTPPVIGKSDFAEQGFVTYQE
jgi:hypothetical protein